MAVTIREYGQLAANGVATGLDRQVLTDRDFAFLKAGALQESQLGSLLTLGASGGQEVLQVQNFVGVVALPSGEQLEILPKTTLGPESAAAGRRTLLKMLAVVTDLDFREAGLADLEILQRPWLETLIRHLLISMAQLVRSGLRRSYARVQAEENFLRGQLRMSAQMRQRLGRHAQFHLSYDQFTLNRPENRLLRSTLSRLMVWTRDPKNLRLCRELSFAMAAVPEASNVGDDLRQWSTSRDMVQYQPFLPWIRLVLNNQTPSVTIGGFEGISLLFPMERLFEDYVAHKLRAVLLAPYRLKVQARARYLVTHRDRPMFRLQPDLVIERGGQPLSILDTKWKLINSARGDSTAKYDLKQADFYQLYAYGEKYLDGSGQLFLVYPKHAAFADSLPSFSFSETLQLWVVPFDIRTDELCLPADLNVPCVSRLVRNRFAEHADLPGTDR